MHAPTGASLLLLTKMQDFHLIRPACALSSSSWKGGPDAIARNHLNPQERLLLGVTIAFSPYALAT